MGCSAFEMQKPKKFVAPKRGGGRGHVRQLENLVCEVGLPQIVLELLYILILEFSVREDTQMSLCSYE